MITTVFVLKDEAETKPGNRVRNKLDQMLRKLDIDSSHVVFVPKSRAVYSIDALQPNVVVPLGAEAFNAVVSPKHAKPLGVTRGEWLRTVTGHKMLASFHPNFVYQNWDNQETIEYDIRKAWMHSHTPNMPLLYGEEYFTCLTLDDVYEARDYLLAAKRMAWDWETEGFDLFDKDELLCVQFSTAPGEGIVIPLRGAWARHKDDVYYDEQLSEGIWRFVEEDGETVKRLCKNDTGKPKIIKPMFAADSVICQRPEEHWPKVTKGHICRGTLTNVWGGSLVQYKGPGRMHGKFIPAEMAEVVEVIREILESDVPKIAHNGKFDIHAAQWQYGIITRRFLYDTMLAYHNFHEKRPHRLEVVQSRFTDAPPHKHMVGTKLSPGKRGSYAEVDNETLWYYGAIDADVEHRLLDPLLAEIERDNPTNGRWLFENIDMPYNRALVQIENNGILVDMDRFEVLVKTYHEAIDRLKIDIDNLCLKHKIDPLDSYNNANTLRPFLYEREYEVVLEDEKWLQCRACKGRGFRPARDENGKLKRNEEGVLLFSREACDAEGCVKGKYQKNPRRVRIMKGMGLPTFGVPRTASDEEKTDKKAFTALKGWTNEGVLYTTSTVNGQPVRRPTKQPLSDTEKKQRAWKRELLTLISRYKQAIQARNLFLDGDPEKQTDGAKAMLSHIRYDGRIHCTYMQLTTTARLSSTAPNLQNIAGEDDEGGYFYGSGLRTMFVAPPGHKLVEVDYSTQEMRILAYLAAEEKLMDVFAVCPDCGEDFRPTDDDPERPWKFRPHLKATGHKAMDLHQGTAAKVFKVDYEAVTHVQRTFAKRVNFGLNYGQGARGLAEVTGLTITEAQELIETYMNTFPKIRKFQDSTKTSVYRGRKIPNAYGRYRHNYGVKEMKAYVDKRTYDKEVSAMFRQCVNHPVQSTPADIMGNVAVALADVWGVEEGLAEDIEAHRIAHDICGFYPAVRLAELGVRMVNLVHDSCLFEVPDEAYDEAINIITSVMERMPWIQLGMYLPVDVKSGRYWGDHGEEKAA